MDSATRNETRMVDDIAKMIGRETYNHAPVNYGIAEKAIAIVTRRRVRPLERSLREFDRLAKQAALGGEANYLLAKIVAAANLGAIDGDDGFVEAYNLPVGPIHKAIKFLNEQGIHITNDGQIKSHQ